MVLTYQLYAVREIFFWFPSVVTLWPSFPLNQVFELTSEFLQVPDLLDLVFVVFEFYVCSYFCVWWRWF